MLRKMLKNQNDNQKGSPSHMLIAQVTTVHSLTVAVRYLKAVMNLAREATESIDQSRHSLKKKRAVSTVQIDYIYLDTI